MARSKVSLTRPVRHYPPVASASVSSGTSQKKRQGTTHTTPPLPIGEGGGCGDYPGQGLHKSTQHKTARHVLVVEDDEDSININRLSLEQKKQLLAQLSLEVNEAAPARDSDMWAVALHKALQDALGGSVGAGGSVHTMKRTAASGAVFTPVLDFMKQSKLLEQPVTTRVSVYHLLAELVVAHARRISRRMEVPLGAKLLSTCQANVASLFDTAFPGYLRSGLAVIVARQLSGRRG